ncbi:hypothetical protein ADUPG1_003586, partial [Aduncisulcus paluster]
MRLLEEKVMQGCGVESVVSQQLSEALRPDSAAVLSIAAAAADELGDKVNDQVQLGLREVRADAEERISAIEAKLDESPDFEPRLAALESRIDEAPDHEPRVAALESRLDETPDHEPRLAGIEEKIEA